MVSTVPVFEEMHSKPPKVWKKLWIKVKFFHQFFKKKNQKKEMLGMKHDKDATEERIKTADMMMSQTNTIMNSFAKLKEDISKLERLKNQYQIYLQMYNNERLLLTDIYQNLKRSLNERDNQKPEILAKQVPKTANISGKLPYAIFLTSLNWEIDVHNPFFSKNHIRLRYVLSSKSVICTAVFNKTGDQFAFADGRTIFLVSAKEGSLLQTFRIPQSLDQKEMQTRGLRFSNDSKYIVSNGSGNLIFLFSTESGMQTAVLEGHSDVVSCFLFTPDSKQLISGGYDGRIIVWDLETKKPIKVINHKDESPDSRNRDQIIVDMVYGIDYDIIIVGFMNGKVGIYETTFTEKMNEFTAHQMPLLGISSSVHSGMICTASQDNTLKIWTIRGIASCRQTLISHTNYVVTSTFSPNCKYMISGSKDESMKLWNVSTGDLECTINAHQNTVFRVDHHPTENSFISCGGDGVICYWDYDVPS